MILGVIYENSVPNKILLGSIIDDAFSFDKSVETGGIIISQGEKLWNFIVRSAMDGDIL